MVIGRCERSNDVIEPRLKTQWFIRTGRSPRRPRGDPERRVRILPERFVKTWEHWMTNIRDWNVSASCGGGTGSRPGRARTATGRSLPIRPARRPARPAVAPPRPHPGPGHLRHLVQFGPVAVLDARLARRHGRPAPFYPTSVMETGYDILFFWVARMMMLGIHLTGDIPFHAVYLSGLIRDPYGAKMSKTKGNVVDPLGMIDETGAMPSVSRCPRRRPASTSGSGRPRSRTPGTSPTSSERDALVLGARPASIAADAPRVASDRALGPAERWILSRVAATSAEVDRGMADFQFAEVTRPCTTASGRSSATGAWSWRRSGWPTRR